jgi:hypothetical protein
MSVGEVTAVCQIGALVMDLAPEAKSGCANFPVNYRGLTNFLKNLTHKSRIKPMIMTINPEMISVEPIGISA